MSRKNKFFLLPFTQDLLITQGNQKTQFSSPDRQADLADKIAEQFDVPGLFEQGIHTDRGSCSSQDHLPRSIASIRPGPATLKSQPLILQILHSLGFPARNVQITQSLDKCIPGAGIERL